MEVGSDAPALREARRGNCPVVVSGDCTTSIGTMAGLQRAGVDAGIVWLDAHGDVQTLETTASGYLGGLPLRLLAGYRPELIADRLGLRPVPERQVPEGPLYVHLDLDLIDPGALPGLRYPAAGGASAAEAARAISVLRSPDEPVPLQAWTTSCVNADGAGPSRR
jgi:arginase